MACTLSDDEARAQLLEWRALSARAVNEVVRTSPSRLELVLQPDVGDVVELILLAQREKRCCRFFTFNIAIDEQCVTLIIEVPEEASRLLDEFETNLL